MFKKILDYFKREVQASEEYCPRNQQHDTPIKPKYTKPMSPCEPSIDAKKERAQKLLDDAKDETVEINNSTTVFDFVYSFQEFERIVKELIRLNEVDGIFMYPSPRHELEQAKSNMEATINCLLSRALGKIWTSGTQWADDVDQLLDEVEMDDYLSQFLTDGNRKRIAQLRERANAERTFCEASKDDKPKLDLTTIDFDQIIRDENEWRRQQYGLSPVEYELEKIDAMNGHEFELWCAKLLIKVGFVDVEVTKVSGDQGVDIVAVMDGVRYAVQCKCYSSDLGNKPVQEVYAGRAMYDCQVGSVMTNRYFTSGAKELADATGIFLWDRDWIKSLLEELEDGELPL